MSVSIWRLPLLLKSWIEKEKKDQGEAEERKTFPYYMTQVLNMKGGKDWNCPSVCMLVGLYVQSLSASLPSRDWWQALISELGCTVSKQRGGKKEKQKIFLFHWNTYKSRSSSFLPFCLPSIHSSFASFARTFFSLISFFNDFLNILRRSNQGYFQATAFHEVAELLSS